MNRDPKNNYRKTEFLCPECLSTLITDEKFEKTCSGDRLKEWESAFKKYKQMNAVKKELYLETLSNKDKFAELYDKWRKYGHMNCYYSNRIYDITPSNTITIPDPLQVKRIEQDTGTTLDLNKLHEESFVWFDGKKFHLKKANGREKVFIEWIQLPYDV